MMAPWLGAETRLRESGTTARLVHPWSTMNKPHTKSRHERKKHNAPRCPKCNDQGARTVAIPGGPYQSKLAPCPYCQAGKAMKAHIAKLSPKEATRALVTGVPGEER